MKTFTQPAILIEPSIKIFDSLEYAKALQQLPSVTQLFALSPLMLAEYSEHYKSDTMLTPEGFVLKNRDIVWVTPKNKPKKMPLNMRLVNGDPTKPFLLIPTSKKTASITNTLRKYMYHQAHEKNVTPDCAIELSTPILEKIYTHAARDLHPTSTLLFRLNLLKNVKHEIDKNSCYDDHINISVFAIDGIF